jgi:N12 class adenine-specific DNA methylase
LADILFPGAAASATRPSNPAADVERIAKAARIPFSVAFALAEAAGAQDPAQQAEVAKRLADTFGPRIAAGEDFRDILRAEVGREADTLFQRADEIAQERYPDLWAKKQAKLAEQQGGVMNALRSGADSTQQFIGSAIEGVGQTAGMQGVEQYGREMADVNRGQAQDAGRGLKTVDDIKGAGSLGQFAAETIANSAPQTALSMAGAAGGALAGSVFGPGGTVIGGIVGGLGVNIPLFVGSNAERQKDEGATQVDYGKALAAAIPAATMDTFVDRLFLGLVPTPKLLQGGGIFTRAVKGAAGGAAVEVPTEMGQQFLERLQAGLPVADEEAIKEYRDAGIAAGLVGGALGGVSGAAQRPKGTLRNALDAGTAAPPSQPQIVSPTNGGTIFAESPVGPPQRDPTEFERAPGSQRTPQGPMGAASTMAPPPIFEGATEGLPVTITGADMDPVEGAFVKETPLAVTVQTADGEILEIPRTEFESGAVAMAPTLPPEPVPVEDRPLVQEGTPPIITEVDPAGLAATAAGAIRRPPMKAKQPERPDATEMSGDDAKARIAFLNDQGKTNGFTPAIVAERDSLQPVVDKADGVITKKDGSPFGDEPSAKRALNKQKLDPKGYDIEARGNGFVARPKPKGVKATPEPEAAAAVIPAAPVVGPDTAETNPTPPAPTPDPQITATPMAPAAVRSQPDMLGGEAVPEEAMAAKERRKREWGQLLGIAEHGKSDWDGEIEGRPVRVRQTRVRVLAGPKPGDQDMTLDTEGMSKEDIAGWLRDTLRRMPPMAQPEVAEVAAQPNPKKEPKRQPEPAKNIPENIPAKEPAVENTVQSEVSTAPTSDDFDANMTDTMIAVRQAIREKKPVSEGGGQVRIGGQTITVDEYAAQVANVEREDAFTRGIRKAIDDKIATATPTPAASDAKADETLVTVKDVYGDRHRLRQADLDNPAKKMLRLFNRNGDPIEGRLLARDNIDADGTGVTATYADTQIIGRKGDDGPLKNKVAVRKAITDRGQKVEDFEIKEVRGGFVAVRKAAAEPAVPTEDQVTDAAPDVAVEPFDADKWDADRAATIKESKANGKTHLDDIEPSVETMRGLHVHNAHDPKERGTVRSVSNTGEVIINWDDDYSAKKNLVPEKTRDGKRDVWQSWLGRNDLKDYVVDGGKAAQVLPPRAPEVSVTQKPDTRPEPAEGPAPEPKPLKGLTDAENERLAALQARFLAKMKGQVNSGLDPEMVAIAVEMGGLYIKAGARRFRAFIDQMMGDMGLTLEQAQPYARNAYNQVRDDLDLAGEDIADMDSAEEVIKEVRKMRAAEAKAPKAPEPATRTGKLPVSQDGAQSGMVQEQEASDEPRDGARPVGLGEDGKQEAGGGGNVEAGQPDGNASDRPVGEAATGPDSGPDAVRGDKAPRARSGRKVRGSANGSDPGGLLTRGGTPDRDDGLVDAGPGRDEPVQPGRSNYRITNPEALFAGGPKARFAKNKSAIEAYQRVSDEGREPTPEELDAMASYIGWGSFGQELFQGTFAWRQNVKPEWRDEDTWLRDFLGKEAWESAQNSIINAHYTDPPTVKAMWAAIEAMGFKGGRVLEPSMGVGNFFGLMPPHLEQASQLTGIELDKTTGGIAKMLYPKANVRIMGYEKSTTPDSFYDLVVGNWPFANFSPADRRYADLNASLHDYFFVKAVDQVRPGGLVVGITSAFSMDGQKNRNVRLHLARRAELVASFRLPSGAFERYAGTKVVTDLIILRKRETPIMDTTQETWVQSKPFKTPSGEDINVNQYYIDNPGQVLGTLDFGSGTTYFKAGMIVRRPDNIGELLDGIAKRVPADGYTPKDRRGKEVRFIANNTTDRRFAVTEGADGALYHVQGDQMAALEDVLSYKTSNKEETAKREAQFRALVDLRRKAGAVIDADRDGAEDADTKRAALKKAYQSFRKAHGPIADSYAIGPMRKKLRDPFAGLLLSLENRDGTPAAIMERPTVRAARKLENPSIRDAFVLARNESVMLDLDRVSEIAGKPLAEVTADLLEAKAIHRTPGAAYQPADVYLAGNVRQKLREAREALAMGEDMAASVAALEEVQPEDIPYFQIEARFGADWLAADINRQFIIETMGIEHQGADDVKLIRGVTGWRVELSDRVARMRGASDITGAPLPGKSGTGLSLRRFIEATLNTQTLSVTESDGDGGTVKDTKSTEKANEKAAELREKFGEWVWKDPERRVEVEASYNEIMNAIATPKVDGSFMEFPGMALQRGDQEFNLRQHQSDAIWRGVLNQRGIYGHEVGSGKTITMTGIAVESRRYGLAKKPLLIAHNANSSAVATEAQETYPGAKIMYVDNLAPDQIEAQLSRMATEDWDMIVIPHSLIDRMALSEATLMQMAADDIAAYEAEAIAAAEDEGIELTTQDMDGDPKDLTKKLFNSPTAKEMVKARNRLVEQIRKQAIRASKEGAVSFESLGIDMILVDESHEFKKPPIPTRMQVKGLNTATSNRALALRFLTSYIKEQRGGTGVHVFTGTPITNTLAEIYHQMYYVMDDVMRVNRVDTWDGFFKAFANTIADVEVTATNEYENVERLAAFINVSELRRMAGQYMDIVFADDMPEFKPRTTDSGKDMKAPDLTDAERKELLDGRRDPTPEKPLQGRPYKQVIHDIAPMGDDQKRILGDVVSYARVFKNAGGKKRREIMLRGGPDAPIVYNNVPNRASMDARLQEINAEDHPQSKANRAVARIAQIYLEEPMATQVLFMDEGYSDEAVSVKTAADGSKTKTKKQKFNLSADIVAKLVKAGVKESEIAIVAGGVTADQKRIISDKMNRREIRVVIGQTKTLGVGVNMQKYLRAMHHLDAPWMPGDLEQRNGRGQRQGNTWNTVLEFRYLTEGLDGRRWQVLAIKDRFIKAFLKAKQGVRTIEGDAADDAESMDGSSLADTLSEASGDPRLMQANKLDKRISKLKSRERIHTQGIAEAIAKAKRLRAQAEQESEALPPRREDSAHVLALRDAGAFNATVNGKAYTERPEAAAAIDKYLEKAALAIPKGGDMPLAVEVNGFKVNGEVPRWATTGQVNLTLARKGSYPFGKPSLASIESAIRRIPERLAETEASLADIEKQAARLDSMAKQPFAQAADLAQKQADLAALKADMEANPVPPPNWLRQGAPIDTLIYVNGEERVVTGHRWTSEGWFVATAEGDVDYGEAKDASGIPLYEPRMFEVPVVSEGSKMKGMDEETEGEQESRMPQGPALSVASVKAGDKIKGSTLPDRRRNALIWFRDNLLSTSVTNAETGMVIRFNGIGAKKSVTAVGDDILAMIPALPQILEQGRYLGSEDGRADRQSVRAAHTFAATVTLDGKPKDVVVIVRETDQGNFEYRLSRDTSLGARFLNEPTGGAVSSLVRTGLEGDTEVFNLQLTNPIRNTQDGSTRPDAPITDAAIASITRDLNAELARSGLGGKASVRVVKGLTNAAGIKVQGLAAGSNIRVDPDAPAGALGTMRHEIIHVTRNAALWGKPYGLYTAEEWRGLVAEARRDKATVARVAVDYKDKPPIVQTEETVAELYREWAAKRDQTGPVAATLRKIMGFLEAVANALRGRGFQSAARTMEKIARGDVGGRGPDGGSPRDSAGRYVGTWAEGVQPAAELRMPDVPYATTEAEFDAKERSFISNLLTDAMGGKSPKYNLLGLVPGRALFAELGKGLPGAQRYLRLKEDMDAMRSDWHGKTDEVAQAWRKIMSGNMDANRSLMDLMHEATREGVDPSKPFTAPKRKPGMTPDEHTGQVARLKTAWNSLHAKFEALPAEFRAMFNTVRDTYDDMASAVEKAVLDNASKAMSIGLERAERRYSDDLAAIRDEGLTGDAKAEAEDAAKKRLATAKKTHGWNKNARISQLRQQFESNRLDGPYFPLQRFGNYFVTVRDVDGKVVSFSRFESEKKQRAFAAEQRRVVGQDVQAGVMEDNTTGLRDQVDPNFVADIEKIIGDTIKDPAIMDMVWQRWLETLPDFSVRKSRIHRKGTPGFDGDAFRAFGRQVFHGSHQLARLTYALDMQKALEDARREAAQTSDPNRNGLIVNEMERRHQFTMNPTGGALAQFATSAAFIMYLGVSPAAALVNLSQTTVIGIPVLSAAFDKGGIGRASKALTGAMRDFVAGRGKVQRSSRLTADEQAAMEEAYRRGVVDKSEAHDIAGVSESGVEYSDRRMWAMSWISLFFHHAERLNREVTFLAAYRMAKDNGFDHAGASQKAADLTWKTHFDYQNTSRPRLMQNDWMKVLLVFRNFQINMLWRLFRDAHQMLRGRSEADRREARAQLIGISAMMMLHAGVKGVWGYALLTTILGLLVPDGSDEVEEEIKNAIVNTFGPGAGGLLLNGVPGHITGIDLTNRLGMPELWFRKSDRQLEGDDEYNYFLQEGVGAVPGIVENVWRGTNLALDGEIWRGVETAAPKFIRDLMKGYRYFDEGVTTIKGDPLLDDLPAGDAFLQAMGFNPAQVSRQYEINTRRLNMQARLRDERGDLLRDATKAIEAGEQIPEDVMAAINEFNATSDNPITGKSIRQSLKARLSRRQRTENGVVLDKKLAPAIREKFGDD